MASIETPPMVEANSEFPTSPITEETMNLLLAPDIGEEDDQDIQMVAEVFYDGGHHQPEEEVQEMDSLPTSSSYGRAPSTSCSTSPPSPVQGEPSKNTPRPASPGPPGLMPRTPSTSRPVSPGPPTTGRVEDSSPNVYLLSPEIVPKLQPTLFDWSAAVENPESVDLDLTWQEKERSYLRTIRELQTFQQNVIKVINTIY